MATPSDDLQPRVRERLDVALAGTARNDPVLRAPDDQRGRLDAAEQVGQRLAVEVRLPGDPERHLAIDVPGFKLIRRWLSPVDIVEGVLIVKAGLRIQRSSRGLIIRVEAAVRKPAGRVGRGDSGEG